jgi:hypothetical protein
MLMFRLSDTVFINFELKITFGFFCLKFKSDQVVGPIFSSNLLNLSLVSVFFVMASMITACPFVAIAICFDVLFQCLVSHSDFKSYLNYRVFCFLKGSKQDNSKCDFSPFEKFSTPLLCVNIFFFKKNWI